MRKRKIPKGINTLSQVRKSAKWLDLVVILYIGLLGLIIGGLLLLTKDYFLELL